ncbi:hypothetical protein ZEAMMB73_Zm00001d045691 [Zea mays]|uniref:Ubiquitin-like protease family profile domain-containing protein n=1 Tax=Zea mays TaxID=4577 RepID=A0A1D6NYA2_MAIZE|nr:hypothetical protein ZEAMMB73_Zm00001d045691 [Zea mays]
MTQMKILKGHMTRVHIENVFQFNFLKRDGDVETKTDELYPIKDMAQICSVERRVLLYLDHDMVFILINIRGMHWYLIVINARNIEIQVLDSLGTSSDRSDLTDSVLMPWKFNECYALFVIDHGKKHVTFTDFTPTQDWCKHMPYKRVNTSYLVLQAMVMWGNGREMEFVRDARILRRNFVIDLLSYEDNS